MKGKLPMVRWMGSACPGELMHPPRRPAATQAVPAKTVISIILK